MIQSDESAISYAGNNSAITPYPVPFLFFVDNDLQVVVTDAAQSETALVLNTDYTAVGEGDPNGGHITTTNPIPVTSRVTIFRVVPATQLTSYEEGDAFPAKSHERALDKLTMLVQQLARGSGGSGDEDLGKAFRLSEASEGINAVAKINDSMLGIDAMGRAILRTSSNFMGWLGQTGTVWADDAERANTGGSFVGQMGIQLDNRTLYVATSIAPGSWVPYLPGTGVVLTAEGTPSSVPHPAGDLVGTTEPQILTNKVLNNPTINNPVGMTPVDVGLDQVDNTSDQNKPLSDADIAALALKQDLAEKGIANGYASLDGGTKVPIAQLPPEALGANSYKGAWNASTNSPSITTGSAPGKQGWFYIVSVAGTTTVDGTASWAVGDTIISNNVIWQKIPVSSAVTSVAGKTGVVVLTKADVGLSNVDNTSVATQNAASATLTNKIIDGASNTLNVRLNTTDVSGNLPTSRLNSGTGAAPNTWWCGDGSWKQPAGTGDVTGPASSLDGEMAVFNGSTGKLVKASGKQGSDLVTGPASATDGSYAVFSGTSGKVLKVSPTIAMPVGSVMDYAGITEPPGWLFCDGRELLQSAYPALYSTIGDTYGVAGTPTLATEKHTSATSGTAVSLNNVVSSGTDRLLLVWIYSNVGASADIAITGITFDGVAMTRQLDWAVHTSMTVGGEFSLWSLVNPHQVTGNVVAAFNKNCTNVVLSAQVFNKVNQTAPLGAAVGSPLTTTNTASISLTVASTAIDLVVDALSYTLAGTYTPASLQQDEFAIATASAGASLRFSQKTATGSSTVMGWDRPSDNYSMLGVAIRSLGNPVFKLPDLRGRVAAGRDDMGGTLAGIMTVSLTGNTTNNSPTISGLSATSSLAVSMWVHGAGIPEGAQIATIASATSITINTDATATATAVALRFGAVDAVTLGAIGGSQSIQLLKSEMPSHGHSAFTNISGGGVAAGSGYVYGATSSTGGDDRHRNVQPTLILNKIIHCGS